jgi:hypothetical protein
MTKNQSHACPWVLFLSYYTMIYLHGTKEQEWSGNGIA